MSDQQAVIQGMIGVITAQEAWDPPSHQRYHSIRSPPGPGIEGPGIPGIPGQQGNH